MPRKSGPKYQPTEFEILSYPLTGGVDTKYNGLVLPAPKLQTCENAYVDQTGSIQRRFGRSLLGSTDQSGNALTGWRASASYQGRVLGFTSSKLYDYSEADARWSDRGQANSFRVRSRQVDAATPLGAATGAAMDMAVLGNYRCYAYDYYTTSTPTLPVTAFTLTDSDGNVIASRQTLQTASAANTSLVKVVAFGTRFYIVYRDTVTTANLKCFVIDTTSATTIASSLGGTAATVAANLAGAFDVQTHVGNGPFVCYRDTTGGVGRLTFGFLSTAGALTSSSTHATVAPAVMVAVDTIGSATVHGIAYTADTTPSDVYATIKSWNGSAWSTLSTSGALDTGLSVVVRQLQCCFDSVGRLRVFFTTDFTSRMSVLQATFTTAGSATSRTTVLVHSEMASRPFRNEDGETCYWAFSGEEGEVAQPTLFLVKQNGTLLGWANQGVAVLPSYDLNNAIQHVATAGGSNTFSMLTPYLASIAAVDFGTGAGAVVGETSVVAMREVIVDMQHAQSHVTVEDGRCLYLPGGILQQYDGAGCTEVGFLHFVDTQNRVTLVSSNGAGSLTNAAGTLYSYHIVPEWTNAQGEREQGTDGGSITTSPFALNDDTVTITIDTVPWTLKKSPRSNLSFAIYRTLANPTSESPFYRVGTVANNPSTDPLTAAETVTFTDTMSDATAETQEQFRFTTELDHVAPPAGHVVASGNGRVFVAGFADDPNLVMYSKTRTHGEALAFNDALSIQFPAATGPITGLAVLNDSLVVFCERAVYRVNGSGLGNAGTSGGYTDPILCATHEGAVGPRGVATTPFGVMFESTGRGICVLNTGFAVAYIGAPLEKLTDPGTCTGSCVVPALQQVRFSFAATTHVYDYYHQQWYVFTHFSEGPTCIWNDAHVAIDDGVVYDDATVWQDAGTDYTMEVVLGWVTAKAARQGDIQVRSIGLVGESLAAHNLDVWVAFDQGNPSSVFDGTTVLAAGPLQEQWRTGTQICTSIEVTIRDALLNVYLADVVLPTAGMRINALEFEIGLRGPVFGREI